VSKTYQGATKSFFKHMLILPYSTTVIDRMFFQVKSPMTQKGYRNNPMYEFFHKPSNLFEFLCECAVDEIGVVRNGNNKHYVTQKLIRFAVDRNKKKCREWKNKTTFTSEGERIVVGFLKCIL